VVGETEHFSWKKKRVSLVEKNVWITERFFDNHYNFCNIENFLIPLVIRQYIFNYFHQRVIDENFIIKIPQVHLSQVRMIKYPTKPQIFKKDYGFLPHYPITLRFTTAMLSHSAIPPSSSFSLKPTCARSESYSAAESIENSML